MRWSDTVDPLVVQAYRSVFGQDRSDVRMVLAHLAEHTGFYLVETTGLPVEHSNYAAGLRAAYGPIFESLSLSDAQLAALAEKAAQAATPEDE